MHVLCTVINIIVATMILLLTCCNWLTQVDSSSELPLDIPDLETQGSLYSLPGLDQELGPACNTNKKKKKGIMQICLFYIYVFVFLLPFFVIYNNNGSIIRLYHKKEIETVHLSENE